MRSLEIWIDMGSYYFNAFEEGFELHMGNWKIQDLSLIVKVWFVHLVDFRLLGKVYLITNKFCRDSYKSGLKIVALAELRQF